MTQNDDTKRNQKKIIMKSKKIWPPNISSSSSTPSNSMNGWLFVLFPYI